MSASSRIPPIAQPFVSERAKKTLDLVHAHTHTPSHHPIHHHPTSEFKFHAHTTSNTLLTMSL